MKNFYEIYREDDTQMCKWYTPKQIEEMGLTFQYSREESMWHVKTDQQSIDFVCEKIGENLWLNYYPEQDMYCILDCNPHTQQALKDNKSKNKTTLNKQEENVIHLGTSKEKEENVIYLGTTKDKESEKGIKEISKNNN